MLAATIAVVLATSSLGAYAQAPATTSDDAAQLAQLQGQLASLQAKVNALEQQQQVQAPQMQTTTPSPAAMASGSWANQTKVSGTMYSDFTHLDQTSNGHRTNASGNGIDVKRFYLSIDHRFNDIWSANLTTDFNYVGNDGETQVYVKKAYLQGDLSKLATLQVGSANMPWIPFVESVYGYRFVENTLIDRMKFGNSADWGVHLGGSNRLFNYQASVINGAGYKNPTRSNSVDFEGRVGITPLPGLVVAVGGYTGDLGHDKATTPALHNAHRVDGLIAYNAHGLRVGAEYFTADNWTTITTPLTDSANGYSAWGSYDFGPAAVFARYDRVKPSANLDPSLKDTYYNAGVAFPLTKGVRVAVAYKDERLHNNTTTDTHTREIGAWGEVKW